jgi:hypothetical protein
MKEKQIKASGVIKVFIGCVLIIAVFELSLSYYKDVFASTEKSVKSVPNSVDKSTRE